jgi:hypothetical protein
VGDTNSHATKLNAAIGLEGGGNNLVSG